MRTTILQPTYLPWLGYFEMIDATEQFVVFDHVQFESGSWQQRNQIRGANGPILLTVPVLSDGIQNVSILDKRIDYRQNWVRKHLRSMELSYQKAPFFGDYFEGFRTILSAQPEKLVDLTLPLILYILDCLGIQRKVRRSCEFIAEDESKLDKTDRVIHLCRESAATLLYDGAAAESFLDVDRVRASGTEITFQHYLHPVYPQIGQGSLPYMSVVDLLFNCGNNSLSIIRSGTGRN
jgi:hypothetical protein